MLFDQLEEEIIDAYNLLYLGKPPHYLENLIIWTIGFHGNYVHKFQLLIDFLRDSLMIDLEVDD